MKFKEKWNSVYGKMGLVLLSFGAVSFLIFLADNHRTLPEDENGYSYVERNTQGGGKKEQELQVQAEELDESYTVEIPEQKYTEDELQDIFSGAGERLEKLVLGENVSLDKVNSDLNLVAELPDTGIRVSWESDNYEAINLQGELQEDHLTEKGTVVELKAVLTYGDETAEHIFYAKLFPPSLNRTQKFLKRLDEEVAKMDEETGNSPRLLLPSSVDGVSVTWRYARNFRAAGVMLIGLAAAMLLVVSEKQKKKEEKKRREEQMELDYPQIISKFTLFLGAGMTARNAWYRMALDYERQKREKGCREAYEQMVYTMHEIKGGTSESAAYEGFGERCGIPAYRKFGAMLSQNLKKGTKGLAMLLQQEAENAFEERKNMAKRLGEEAGTKILIPMFLMLAVVLIIIVVPAFFSIQI